MALLRLVMLLSPVQMLFHLLVQIAQSANAFHEVDHKGHIRRAELDSKESQAPGALMRNAASFLPRQRLFPWIPQALLERVSQDRRSLEKQLQPSVMTDDEIAKERLTVAEQRAGLQRQHARFDEQSARSEMFKIKNLEALKRERQQFEVERAQMAGDLKATSNADLRSYASLDGYASPEVNDAWPSGRPSGSTLGDESANSMESALSNLLGNSANDPLDQQINSERAKLEDFRQRLDEERRKVAQQEQARDDLAKDRAVLEKEWRQLEADRASSYKSTMATPFVPPSLPYDQPLSAEAKSTDVPMTQDPLSSSVTSEELSIAPSDSTAPPSDNGDWIQQELEKRAAKDRAAEKQKEREIAEVEAKFQANTTLAQKVAADEARKRAAAEALAKSTSEEKASAEREVKALKAKLARGHRERDELRDELQQRLKSEQDAREREQEAREADNETFHRLEEMIRSLEDNQHMLQEELAGTKALLTTSTLLTTEAPTLAPQQQQLSQQMGQASQQQQEQQLQSPPQNEKDEEVPSRNDADEESDPLYHRRHHMYEEPHYHRRHEESQAQYEHSEEPQWHRQHQWHEKDFPPGQYRRHHRHHHRDTMWDRGKHAREPTWETEKHAGNPMWETEKHAEHAQATTPEVSTTTVAPFEVIAETSTAAPIAAHSTAAPPPVTNQLSHTATRQPKVANQLSQSTTRHPEVANQLSHSAARYPEAQVTTKPQITTTSPYTDALDMIKDAFGHSQRSSGPVTPVSTTAPSVFVNSQHTKEKASHTTKRPRTLPSPYEASTPTQPRKGSVEGPFLDW